MGDFESKNFLDRLQKDFKGDTGKSVLTNMLCDAVETIIYKPELGINRLSLDNYQKKSVENLIKAVCEGCSCYRIGIAQTSEDFSQCQSILVSPSYYSALYKATLSFVSSDKLTVFHTRDDIVVGNKIEFPNHGKYVEGVVLDVAPAFDLGEDLREVKIIKSNMDWTDKIIRITDKQINLLKLITSNLNFRRISVEELQEVFDLTIRFFEPIRDNQLPPHISENAKIFEDFVKENLLYELDDKITYDKFSCKCQERFGVMPVIESFAESRRVSAIINGEKVSVTLGI